MRYHLYHYFIYLMVLGVIAGCSSSKSAKLIPIAASEGSYGNNAFTEMKGTDPNSTLMGYATAIRSCGHSERASLRGTTRQLFVGLENLKIMNQEPLEIPPHHLWAVEAQAQSDGFPVQIVTYTVKQSECFIDFVLWVPSSMEAINSELQQQEFADLRLSFKTLVQQTLPEVMQQF